jgi:hypothetical protein
MKRLAITAMFFPIFLASCSWDPGGFKAQKEWSAQKKEEKLAYDRQVNEDQKNRLKKQEKDKAKFEDSHPEVEVTGLGNAFKGDKAKSLRDAFNSLSFVTRYPDTSDMQQVYVKVGDVNLTLKRIKISLDEQLKECQRISTYSGYDIENQCLNQVGRGLSNFAMVLKDPNTPDLTKKAALGEASFGNYIDFDHAARLAVMHNEMCKKQGNNGYVEMVTVAAPCKNYKGAGIN